MDQRYISKELTHFVGRGLSDADEQYALMTRILRAGWLTHSPHFETDVQVIDFDFTAKASSNSLINPGVICFCDIPLADFGLHMSKYSSFGIAFRKDYMLLKGATPVVYIPRQSGRDPQSSAETFDRELTRYVMIREAYRRGGRTDSEVQQFTYFLDFHVFSLLKFYDGTLEDLDPENYYMEREWRIVGNMQFGMSDVERIIVPPDYGSKIREDFPDYDRQVTFI